MENEAYGTEKKGPTAWSDFPSIGFVCNDQARKSHTSSATVFMNDYILSHSTPPDSYLHSLYRATHLHLLRPRMASGDLQGQLLRMFMQMIRPRTVVEIGTYSGYSALAMASGMDKGSKVYTFEINDEQECFTRPWLENAPYDAKVEMFVGNIFELLPPMGLSIDVAFIDANKREYVEYYDLLMPYMHSGSIILADNTLWDGHVIDPAYDHDAQTIGIRKFNDYVAQDSRVEQIILPERDGLTLIRVR